MPSYLMTTDRDSSQWGKNDFHLDRANQYPGVDPSPYMPRPGMFPGIMQSIAHVPWSGSGVQSGTHSVYWLAGYYRALRQGKMDAARLSAENFRMSIQKFAFDNSKEMSEAHDILSAYGGTDKQGKNMKNTQAMRDAWEEYLRNHHDPTVRMILDNSGDPYTALTNLFSTRDTTLLNVNKAISQHAKDDQGDPSLWGGGDSSQTQQPSTDGDKSTEGPTPAGGPDTTTPPPANAAPATPGGTTPPAQDPNQDPTQPPPVPVPAQPAPSSAPDSNAATPSPQAGASGGTSTADPAVQMPAPTNTGEVIPHVAGPTNTYKVPGVLPGLVDVGRSELRGRTVNLPYKREKEQAEKAATAMGQELSRISEDDKLNARQALQKFRTVDATMAEWARQIANNDRPMPGASSMSGGTTMDVGGLLGQMVMKLNPHWEGTQYKFKQEFINANGRVQQAFQATGRLGNAEVRLAEEINKAERQLGPDSTAWQRLASRLGTQAFGSRPGDQIYAGLNSAWLAFSRESIRVQNGGNPEVTPPEQIMDLVRGSTSPLAMREVFRNEAYADVAQLEAAQQNWQLNMKVNTYAPGYAPQTYGLLTAFGERMDPNGRISGNVPREAWNVAFPDLKPDDRDAVVWSLNHPNDARAKRWLKHWNVEAP
jgi:hypothetical protein